MAVPPDIPGIKWICMCGKGGRGTVWAGRDAEGTLLAVKVIPRGAVCGRERIAVEAYRKNFPDPDFLMPILRTGRIGNAFYYVMALADNAGISGDRCIPDTLAYRLQTRRMELPEVMTVFREIVAGVRELHARGFAHRDLKPENILFLRGRVRIGDPDLLCSLGQWTSSGTPEYTPPVPTPAGERDLFALGKMLYCMYTGEGPESYPSLPDDLPAGRFGPLNRIAMRCCDPHPERYRSVEELQKDLTKVVNGMTTKQYSRPTCRRYAPGYSLLLVLLLVLGAHTGCKKRDRIGLLPLQTDPVRDPFLCKSPSGHAFTLVRSAAKRVKTQQ